MVAAEVARAFHVESTGNSGQGWEFCTVKGLAKELELHQGQATYSV